jgi:hypothetical protein
MMDMVVAPCAELVMPSVVEESIVACSAKDVEVAAVLLSDSIVAEKAVLS